MVRSRQERTTDVQYVRRTTTCGMKGGFLVPRILPRSFFPQESIPQSAPTPTKEMLRISFFLLAALTATSMVYSAPTGVIDDTVDAVEDAYDTTASWVDGAADTVGDTAEDAYDSVASRTGSIIDDVSSAHTLAVASTAILAAIGLVGTIL
ncbi:unnamed protein product [Phytophthora fragariaefolia]|uniref:Unnamed protein product n=1 Tax=Phytophthora fragariaefolia TaxID=1490495 RepID=A0A9W6XLT3_9STRA|nr:unnamed protein product [Phytophthora fragariaefolia]